MAASPQTVQNAVQAANPNPTGVNPFNGVSDSAVAAKHFESLYEKGAFAPPDEPGKEPPAPQVLQPPPEAVDPPPEPQAPAYSSIEDYLTQAKVDTASFFDLPVAVKVDGESKQVPFKEVLKSYQLEGHVNNKSIALAEQQRAFEAERTQAAAAIRAQLEQASTMGQIVRQNLLAEFQGIDWNRLRAEDPVTWAVKNTEFNQRANAIDAQLAQVAEAQRQQAAQAQAEMQKVLPKERDRMLEARPEWRDDTKFQAARTQMGEFARKMGFSDAELSGIYDHRYMLILDMAARFAQLQASAPQTAKLVRAAPQAASPGARQERDPSAVARTQAKDAFRKNPRDQDAAARYFGTLA